MASGPTQNYHDATLGQWKPHPALAVLVRVVVLALPPLGAIVFGLVAVRWASPARLGMDAWAWLAVEVALSTVMFLVVDRMCRHLLPLSALLRLTVFFPDQAPTRFAVALRRHSPHVLHERLEAARGHEDARDEEHQVSELLLGLVSALGDHDESTRGHSERVQAYSALIGAELGLSEDESAKLSWAALLHDVGKLRTPLEILNKSGRPTEDEWDVLASHPSTGMEIAEPLAAWLGPWVDAVGQHHERWDGDGYPRGLAGDEISLGARIVAVADAFDAITSTRAYKKPLSAAAARAELARCAGRQFDPEIVRAFLALSLGRLRKIAGPASALAALPGFGSMPQPAIASLMSGASTAATAGVAAAAAGIIGVVLSATGVAGAASATQPDQRPTAYGSGSSAAGSAVASPTTGPSTGSTPSGESVTGLTPPVAAPTDASVDGVAPPAALTPGQVVHESATSPAPAPASASAPAAAPAPAGAAAAAAPAPATVSVPSGLPCAQAQAGATSMADAALSGCVLTGLTLTGDYSGANLAGADLSGATLTALDLSGANLSGAKLDGATISSTSFEDARLSGASFVGAVITDSRFEGAWLAPTTLKDAQVSGSTFD